MVALGEHTRQILQELGYSEEEMARLKEQGVIDWAADSETLVAAPA
jgi:hypothetical protein